MLANEYFITEMVNGGAISASQVTTTQWDRNVHIIIIIIIFHLLLLFLMPTHVQIKRWLEVLISVVKTERLVYKDGVEMQDEDRETMKHE